MPLESLPSAADGARLTPPAAIDPVTGLLTLPYVLDRLQYTLALQTRRPGGMAVVHIALENFAELRASEGAAVATGILLAFSQRLAEAVRLADSVARLKGEHFGCLLDGINSARQAERAAERYLSLLQERYTVEDQTITVQVRAGVALSTPCLARRDGAVLLQDAQDAWLRATAAASSSLWVLAAHDHPAFMQPTHAL